MMTARPLNLRDDYSNVDKKIADPLKFDYQKIYFFTAKKKHWTLV